MYATERYPVKANMEYEQHEKGLLDRLDELSRSRNQYLALAEALGAEILSVQAALGVTALPNMTPEQSFQGFPTAMSA